MANRLEQLAGGARLSVGPDLEAGMLEQEKPADDKFEREVQAVEKLITSAVELLDKPVAEGVKRTQQLEAVEVKMRTMRRQLRTLADANHKFAAENTNAPSSVRIRIVRYTKCANDFIALTERLGNAYDEHRRALAAEMKSDVMRVNPGVPEALVESAIETGQLDLVLADTKAARMQMHDIEVRNSQIKRVEHDVAQLSKLFNDMSILVQAQQNILNHVEQDLVEVHLNAAKANDDLVQANEFRKSRRNLRICGGLTIALIVLVAIVLLVYFLFRR